MDRQYRLALAISSALAIALAAVSVEFDWSVAAIYGAFALIAAIIAVILTRNSPPRTPGNRRG